MLAVVVRTVRLLAVGPVLTLFHLQEVGVVLLLLPPVGVQALVLVRAALPVGADEVVYLPSGAHLAAIREDRGTPSVVLPVVRIHADLPVVVVLPIRTPHCLEQEHVKVHVDFIPFDQLD